MICAICSEPNPDDATQCARCTSLLPTVRSRAVEPSRDGVATAAVAPSELALDALLRDVARIPPVLPPGSATTHASALVPGATLGPRYEIVKLIGRGGMGAVYLARDRELSRLVAMKLIAPHLSAEGHVLERFKREVTLSTIVTHPNVLRVFDLGEHDGLTFLTMQYIDGETLAEIMHRRRPLPVDEGVSLIRQICAGLGAAHAKGVLHRDLKPQNVLVDRGGNALLTDFGLATSQDIAAITQTGALLGTPHYMSPEQVKGQHCDARSDIFAAGVILYEMLSGKLPFDGDSVYEIMIARTRGPPRPVAELNPGIPVRYQRILERCLAQDPADRYGSAEDVLRDFESPTPPPAARHRHRGGGPVRPRLGWKLAAAAAGALALAATVPFAIDRLRGKVTAPALVRTVLVADFDNRTGEDVFNGTLEPAIGIALEGASFVSTYNRAAARKIADRLKLEGEGLSEKRARLVAQREGVGVVTAGFVEREGRGYQLGVRVIDAFTGQKVTEVVVGAADRASTLGAISKLSARVRGALGDITPAGVQLKEAETFSARSLEAAHAYAVANDLALFQGKYDEARTHYLEAIRLDPGMGRAYSGLAVIEANRNRSAEAEKHFAKAMELVDRMTERERLRTRGLWYFRRRDTAKSIEAFEELVRKYPADSAGLANLAMAYSLKSDFTRALELARRAVAIYPRNVPQRSNVGYFAMYAGDFAAAVEEQRRALEQNPRFAAALVGLALAQAASGELDGARSTWRTLEATGAAGASAAAEGLADLAAVEGRLREAQGILSEGVERDLASGDRDAAGRKMVMAAQVLLAAGDATRAAASAERTLRTTEVDYVRFLAALVLAETGRERRALALAGAFDERWEPDPRMFAELVRGMTHLRRREHPQAVERFRSGLDRHDAWIARLLLGRAYLQAGALEQARDELEACERRRGEATDLFVESVPTYRLYPAVLYHLARAREALRSPAAAETYRGFLALKRSDEEPMAADARRRLAALQAR